MKAILNAIRSFINDPFQQTDVDARKLDYLNSVCDRISQETGETYCVQQRVASHNVRQFEIVKL